MNHLFQNWTTSPSTTRTTSNETVHTPESSEKMKSKEVKGMIESSPWVLVDDPNRKLKEQISKKSLYHYLFNSSFVPLDTLRGLSLKGIPSEFRSRTWRYLLSLCPPSPDLYSSALDALSVQFQKLESKYFVRPEPSVEAQLSKDIVPGSQEDENQREILRDRGFHGESIFGLQLRDCENELLLHQIEVDVKRTSMGKYWKFFSLPTIQKIMCRALLVWSLQTPELGYIQGLTDLIAPMCIVFSADHLGGQDKLDEWVKETGEKVIEKGREKVKHRGVKEIDEKQLEAQRKREQEINTIIWLNEKEIQRDIYFCFERMMSYKASLFHFRSVIVERNTQFLVSTMRYLVSLRDPSLVEYLDMIEVDFFHFTFRWLVTLLIREFPLDCGIRLFDTFFAEGEDFTKFHTYICASFLLHFGDQLKQKKDFQESLLFLQRLPTSDWTVSKFEEVVIIPAYRLLDVEKKNYDRLLNTLDHLSKLLIPVTILHHRMNTLNYLTCEQQNRSSSLDENEK